MKTDRDREDEATTALRPGVLPALEGPIPSYVVKVIEGPDRGKTFRVDGTTPSRVLVGKSPACELVLADPSVSRRHAAIDSSEGRLRLTDLGSKNGTVVNDLHVTGTFLSGIGETIRLGDSVLRVELESKEGPAPASRAMRFGRVVGASLEMRRIYPLCERLAASDVPVVLEGETGTGKEQLAEALHEAGPRASGPFVVFDCTAVPPNLLESALFGHERGAFTGAVAARKGVFEQAHKGTLLIDEIGDLDLALQPKLLRAIQRGEVQRVGSDKWTKVDVRVLAATRRDLDREVQEGRFRDDLFFRLAVARVELPPLRRRQGDVPILARHFWRQLGGTESLPDEFLQRLEAYEWPGNVRELYNAIARRLALGELASVETPKASVPPPPSSASSLEGAATGDSIARVLAMDLPFPRARQHVLEEFERRYIERVLTRYGGNVVKAAAASGIARRYFQIIRARQPK